MLYVGGCWMTKDILSVIVSYTRQSSSTFSGGYIAYVWLFFLLPKTVGVTIHIGILTQTVGHCKHFRFFVLGKKIRVTLGHAVPTYLSPVQGGMNGTL